MSVFGNDELFEEFEDESEISTESESNEDASQLEEKYKEECQALKQENEKLKKSLRILTRPLSIKIKDVTMDGPVAQVLLFNNLIARKSKEKIQDFFHELCSSKPDKDDRTKLDNPQRTFVQFEASSKRAARRQSSKRTEAAVKAFQAFGCYQIYKKFYIDQLGEPLAFEDPSMSEWNLPAYDRTTIDPLTGDPDEPVQRRKKVLRMCFNCGESDHQLKDCPEKKDYNAINQRRKNFMDQVERFSDGSPQIRLSGARYHMEDANDSSDVDENYSNFKPGVISKNLHEALGMNENDIPPYIYQMRRCGYPPGHLENAKYDPGIVLYNSQSKENGSKDDHELIDVEKIISYPGFNIPPLPGQIDNYKEHGVYPMDDRDSREAMISYYEHKNNLQKKQMETEEENHKHRKKKMSSDVDMEEIDMEMADDDEEVVALTPKETYKHDENHIEIEDGELGVNVAEMAEKDVGSLSQDELEIRRQNLLKELESEMKSGDSDYRESNTAHIIDLTEVCSDSDNAEVQILDPVEENSDIEVDPVAVEEVVLVEDTSTSDKESEKLHTQENKDFIKMAVCDTDYRMCSSHSKRSKLENPDCETSKHECQSDDLVLLTKDLGKNVSDENVNTVKSESSSPETVTQESIPGASLPDRRNFAKGITQFDAYYIESKSRGVYKKLSSLLRDSPRRQEKSYECRNISYGRNIIEEKQEEYKKLLRSVQSITTEKIAGNPAVCPHSCQLSGQAWLDKTASLEVTYAYI